MTSKESLPHKFKVECEQELLGCLLLTVIFQELVLPRIERTLKAEHLERAHAPIYRVLLDFLRGRRGFATQIDAHLSAEHDRLLNEIGALVSGRDLSHKTTDGAPRYANILLGHAAYPFQAHDYAAAIADYAAASATKTFGEAA